MAKLIFECGPVTVDGDGKDGTVKVQVYGEGFPDFIGMQTKPQFVGGPGRFVLTEVKYNEERFPERWDFSSLTHEVAAFCVKDGSTDIIEKTLLLTLGYNFLNASGTYHVCPNDSEQVTRTIVHNSKVEFLAFDIEMGELRIGNRADVTGDGKVDLLDMLAVRNHMFEDVDQLNAQYDVTGDGVINILDMIMVRNNLD